MAATTVSATIYALDAEQGYVADKTKLVSMTLSVHALEQGLSSGIISTTQVFIDADEARDIIERLNAALAEALG